MFNIKLPLIIHILQRSRHPLNKIISKTTAVMFVLIVLKRQARIALESAYK